jgi:translation initiation factor IF-2
MSKVRIYELAKEAGLKSKELADKLIALGYPIKSHSSTVEDDIAADIRRKVISSTAAEVSEERVDVSRPVVVRKKVTAIRRRSRADKEEIARKVEEAEAAEVAEAAFAAEIADFKASKATESADHEAHDLVIETDESVSADVQKESAGIEKMMVDEVNQSDDQKISEMEKISSDFSEIDQEVGMHSDQYETDDAVTETDSSVEEVEESVELPKRAKGLAKIVGQVVIQVPEQENTERTVKKPSRTAKPGKPGKPSKPVKRPKPVDQVAIDSLPETGFGADSKKTGVAKPFRKGKRVVQIDQNEADEKAKKLAGKVKTKGRRKIDFTTGEAAQFTRPRKGKGRKSGQKKLQNSGQLVAETKAIKKRIKVYETISVGDLAKRMGIKANEIIAKLMSLGVMATLNQSLDIETAILVAADFGYEVEQGMTEELGALQLQEEESGGEELPRPPVVTVMGHVDHGKTSILDAIRKTDVAAGEAGGITQHIGAYHVQSPAGDVTFVDTPGHAAFTEMRSRGAKVTDIVVLVVAADDGVMDQTKEAIAHSKAADVPIVVAVNKIDKDNADPDRVKRELSDYGLIPEEWGGNTIYCHTSAKHGVGIEALLENIQLQAEILELKADPSRKAKGTVIEAQLHKGRGAVATVLIQEGTLRVGDYFVAGLFNGKVRSLSNERGENIEKAGPSTPVEIQGLTGVPHAGDEFIVVTDEKMAKNLSNSRQLKAREFDLASASKVSLDNLFEKMAEQEVKELRVVLRADVQGTLEAFCQAAEKLSTAEIKVRVLHEGTGSMTENDIHLASASEAIIIGFNVRPTVKVKELAERENVDIRSYDVIYHALEDIEKAMVGMLEPTFEERVIGTAEVRQTFHVPKIGTIAGCMIIDGKMQRNAMVRVLREGVVVYTGTLSSLRRFKDDAKEVLSGYECGIGVENFNDIKVNDTLEAFLMDEVEATL